MGGLYIHIPFCRSKCYYCNFYSLPTRRHQEELIDTLLLELEQQKDFFGQNPLGTVYLGGGTPSLMPVENIKKLIDRAIQIFGIVKDPEITVEANPEDVTPDWLRQLKQTPVNRISIGVQSFHDEDLRYLSRRHSAATSVSAIRSALDHGFSNLSIDLIYGIPTLSDKNWTQNIETALSFDIPHISAYALTVEPTTILERLIHKGKYLPVSDDHAANQFDLLIRTLTSAGYEHYEISNFARPGWYSRHNTLYWKGEKYLGIGPSAHSFNGITRKWNISHLEKYMQGIRQGNPAIESEDPDKNQQFNEYVMTALRTMWGIDLNFVRKKFGEDFSDSLYREASRASFKEFLQIQNGIITLTHRGKFFADRIAADLFR